MSYLQTFHEQRKWRFRMEAGIISVVGNSSLLCPFPFVLWTPLPRWSPDLRPEACSDLKFYFDSASTNLSLWWLRYQLTARMKGGVKFFFMTVEMKVSTFFLLSVARNSLKWAVSANFVLSMRICGHRSSCCCSEVWKDNGPICWRSNKQVSPWSKAPGPIAERTFFRVRVFLFIAREKCRQQAKSGPECNVDDNRSVLNLLLVNRREG